MTKVISVALMMLLLGLLAPAPASAQVIWGGWGKVKEKTQARIQGNYSSGPNRRGLIQIRRKKSGSTTKRKVTYRSRPLDTSANPIGGWTTGSWKKIKRGKKVTLRGASMPCSPGVFELQAIVKVKRSKGWSKAKVLKRLRGSAVSACA